jgi:hypothetical protein
VLPEALDDPVDPLATEDAVLDVPELRLAVADVVRFDEMLLKIPVAVPDDPIDIIDEFGVTVVLDNVFVIAEKVELVVVAVCMLELNDTVSVLPVVVEESKVMSGGLDV